MHFFHSPIWLNHQYKQDNSAKNLDSLIPIANLPFSTCFAVCYAYF